MQSDLNKVLIEGMLKKAVKDFQSSPGRTVRNLIDLGVNFSKGRFQKRLLCIAQEMLQNPESAYYQLFTDIVKNVDMDLLIRFGMNLGYNSCTKGAKVIRQIEAEKGFNIPWSLTLQINPEKQNVNPTCYSEILEQGVSLGIYTYFLFLPSGDAEQLIPLFQGQPDCAFVIFLRGNQFTDAFLESVKKSQNVMLSVYNNEKMPEACARLQEKKLLFAVYERYEEEAVERILSNRWIEVVQMYRPQAAVLFADSSCSNEVREKVYRHILDVRTNQKYPVLFLDLIKDAWEIDEVISEDAYVVGFDGEGNMSTYDGTRKEEHYNIFGSTLETVLRNTIKKQ